jgi:hypothetical protein
MLRPDRQQVEPVGNVEKALVPIDAVEGHQDRDSQSVTPLT